MPVKGNVTTLKVYSSLFQIKNNIFIIPHVINTINPQKSKRYGQLYYPGFDHRKEE
jgi:hypothetical protein